MNIFSEKRLFWLLVTAISGTFLSLLVIYDIQFELIKEHTRFRDGFPSQSHWEYPSAGRLKCFFFDFKNLESFLNGTDAKIEVEEVGPASFIVGMKHSNITHHPENSTISYRKLRYHSLVFDEEASAPGILNRTLTVPNYIILATAAKLQSKFFFVKSSLNVISAGDSVFLKRTPYELLFNFSSPTLNRLSRVDFSVDRNAGFLVESMENKMEWFNVNVGLPSSEDPMNFNHFFRINHINEKRMSSGNSEWDDHDYEKCPISVVNASDCTLFPPYLQKDAKLAIATSDSCRTFPMEFHREEEVKGYNAYRFGIKQDPANNCFRNSADVPLPEGMFDVSKCHHGEFLLREELFIIKSNQILFHRHSTCLLIPSLPQHTVRLVETLQRILTTAREAPFDSCYRAHNRYPARWLHQISI